MKSLSIKKGITVLVSVVFFSAVASAQNAPAGQSRYLFQKGQGGVGIYGETPGQQVFEVHPSGDFSVVIQNGCAILSRTDAQGKSVTEFYPPGIYSSSSCLAAAALKKCRPGGWNQCGPKCPNALDCVECCANYCGTDQVCVGTCNRTC